MLWIYAAYKIKLIIIFVNQPIRDCLKLAKINWSRVIFELTLPINCKWPRMFYSVSHSSICFLGGDYVIDMEVRSPV